MTGARFWTSAAAIWAVVAMLLMAVAWAAIVAWRFPDPDDQMRLLQVRDLLAGQGWFDVTQYRLNPPAGVPMHWSRLVDLPIAAVIAVLTPLIGAAHAEHAALIVVPLATLAVVMALVGAIARRMLDDEAALLTVCLAPLSVEVMHQLRPMRIDHHGWQMALALIATLGLIDRRRVRGGAIAGLALATWLAISLEGLPMIAAVFAVVALRWVVAPQVDAALMRATAAVAAAASLILFIATASPAAWRTPACDAMSPPYIAALGVAAIGMVAVTLLPLRSWPARLAALGVVGAAALATIPLVAPACAAGPFARLDPLVRELWYMQVMEGLPMWRQTPVVIVNSVVLPLIGIAGAALGWRTGSDEARLRWATLLFLTMAATAAAILVQRSSGVAALIAVPGAARLIHPALLRARTIASVPLRTLATLAILILAAPGLAIPTITNVLAPDHETAAVHKAMGCVDADDLGALRALPTGRVLAPLDISPAILVLTGHAAVASGHHRGSAAMHDVITAFTGTEAAARAIVRRRGVDYVVVCPGVAETILYERTAPTGLLAGLEHGRVPAWLRRVVLPGSSAQVWRVVE